MVSLLADTSSLLSVANLPNESGSEYSWLVDRSSLRTTPIPIRTQHVRIWHEATQAALERGTRFRLVWTLPQRSRRIGGLTRLNSKKL
jgi:hypothetical protein